MTNKLIYVIEQDPTVREMLKFSVEKRFKVDVRTFGSAEAFTRAMGKVPDLIIMDFNMGEEQPSIINGLQMMRQLKKDYPKLPVILFSNQLDFKLALESLRCGATEYIDRTDDEFYDNIIRSVRQILKFGKAPGDASWSGLKGISAKLRMAFTAIGLPVFILWLLTV